MLDLCFTINDANPEVPYEEKVRDHNLILNGYFDTHAYCYHSDRTLELDQRYLRGFFEGCKVHDDSHPAGRQLFIWEAMNPAYGRQIVSDYASGLGETDLRTRTNHSYIGKLRDVFAHVMKMPFIPRASARLDTPLLIETKYNPIFNPVTKYDCPPPTEEPPSESPLVDDKLGGFISWCQEDHLPMARIPITAARTYTQIVTVTQCGFRECEMEGLDALGDNRDIDYARGTIRTRFGKGSRGSGPRTRTIELSRFARDTIKHYEDCVLGEFPVADSCAALFRSQRGNRLGYWCTRSALRVVVKEARKAGLILPNDMGWHSLRRSFAMQYLDCHPGQIWELLQIMGHGSYLSLIRYLRPTPEMVNAALEKSFAWVAGKGAI